MFLFDNKYLGYARQSRVNLGLREESPDFQWTWYLRRIWLNKPHYNSGERKLMESATENNRYRLKNNFLKRVPNCNASENWVLSKGENVR